MLLLSVSIVESRGRICLLLSGFDNKHKWVASTVSCLIAPGRVCVDLGPRRETSPGCVLRRLLLWSPFLWLRVPRIQVWWEFDSNQSCRGWSTFWSIFWRNADAGNCAGSNPLQRKPLEYGCFVKLHKSYFKWPGMDLTFSEATLEKRIKCSTMAYDSWYIIFIHSFLQQMLIK